MCAAGDGVRYNERKALDAVSVGNSFVVRSSCLSDFTNKG